MTARIETILAEIVSPQYLWLKTRVEKWDPSKRRPATVAEGDDLLSDYDDRRVICLVGTYKKSVGIKQGSVGWEEVRQLAFAFAEEDWPYIYAFYATHGPLGDPEWQRLLPGQRERVGWAKAALEWFRVLTVLVEALQNHRVGQLWEYFGLPRTLPLPELTTPLYFAGPHLRGDATDLDYSLRWVPSLDGKGRSRTPQDETELFAATWGLVTQAVEMELARVPLTPVRRNYANALYPKLSWGFQAAGTLHEGFLDWFFRVFAPLKIATCRAQGCDHPVLAPRRIYCSTTCKNRQKQRDYRQRKALPRQHR